MLRVLVAEDSPTVRALLVGILESDPGITVVGEARNGLEVIQLAAELRPDLITMDVNMPGLDGLEATKEIMVKTPTPIIVVSAATTIGDVELSLSATRAGALMAMRTPESPASESFQQSSAELIAMVKAMASVKVVRRHSPHPRARTRAAAAARPRRANGSREIVAIAASTGGPAALQRILMDLPGDFPSPILVVQHIARGFVTGFCHWLHTTCDLRIRIAVDGEPLESHTVYIAPDEHHLGVGRGHVVLSDQPAIGGFRPSANFLFESAGRSYGSALVSVILTGMGRDGVEGLATAHDLGSHVIAQDEMTSVVYGMPREAFQAGYTDEVIPLDAIATRLQELVKGAP